ncbi:DUF3592 domain-containing protein [Enemella sp. A6]|uniref:DUF3592 domain-containing protein n=1 Tax=Enemella sp. A6 TaxID=3440152 RepID=UPI003EB8C682
MNGFTPGAIPPDLPITPSLTGLLWRSQHQRLSPSPTGWALTGLTLMLFALFTFTLVPILDIFRQMLTQPFEDWEVEHFRAGTMIAMSVFVTLGSMAGTAAMRLGGTIRTGLLLSNGAGWTGAGIGVAAGWSAWTAPEWFDPAWGWLELIAYWLPVWLPTLLLLAGVSMLIGALASISAAKARAAKREQLRRAGHQAVGRIVEVTYTHVKIMDDPQFRVTVAFNTPQGPQQATRNLVVPEMSVPVRGTPVTVLYDPQRPGEAEFDHSTFWQPDTGWPTHPATL